MAWLLLSSCSTLRLAPPGGTLLGESFVDSSDQTSRVSIKAYSGTVKAIRFMANGNEIEIEKIILGFDGGEKLAIDEKLLLSVGALSRRIELTGAKPALKSIEFTYRPVGSWMTGRTDILVYGIK